jgi:division protein CdvB (Snf7/Vps24/ESCRT-III family)
LVRIFQPPPQPIGEVIQVTTKRLKLQQMRLEQATSRLRERDRTLFNACVFQVRMKHRERAGIVANELSEVRKVLNMVTQCHLALERIILRLETIQEVSQIMADLKPALRSLRELTETMVNVMPDVAAELQRVNESINDTLAVTKLTSAEDVAPLIHKTEAGQEILKEASAMLEKRIGDELPLPPMSVVSGKAEAPRESKKKQMVALSATCSEITQPAEEREKGEPQSYVTYKDVKLREVSYRIEQQPLEDVIMQYAKEQGEIDLERCAEELSVPHEELEKALENLGKKQKIVIQR